MKTRRQLFVADAPVGADRGPLSALVAYEQQVVFSYQVTLMKAPLTKRERATIADFERQAAQAAAALRTALRQEGGTPTPAPDPATAPPPSDPSLNGFLRDLIAVEEASVTSYYRALQDLVGERHLAASAAFMAQAGRRLVVLRHMTGQPLLPRAFETGAA